MAAGNNPAFNNPAFQERGSGAKTKYAPPAAPQTAADAALNAQLEGAYAAPPAGAIETGRMTVEDTVLKTLGLFVVLLVGAVVGWLWTMAPVTATNPSPTMVPWLIGALGGFVLAMVVIFTSSKKVRPGLIIGYAAFEGLFVGAISAFFEFIWPGIVVQATIATLSVVGVTLALFASGKVRASARATKIFMIAMVGYLVYSIVNVIVMMFGGGGMFGLSSEPSPLFGIPWGALIGVIVVIMAAYSLVLDFDSIQQGVRNGAPRQLAWMGAFGIMVTVVWLYVEILRLIAILRGNN